tara:strand:+ start:523 stop:657 length:135 start_codon:yes stop_codon:yes gene_type:complete
MNLCLDVELRMDDGGEGYGPSSWLAAQDGLRTTVISIEETGPNG